MAQQPPSHPPGANQNRDASERGDWEGGEMAQLPRELVTIVSGMRI